MKTFRDLVILEDDSSEPMTTTKLIADKYGLRHTDMLRALKNKGLVDRSEIALVDYIDNKGEKRPCYMMDERQCLMLLPFMAGEKAFDVQERLVDAFIEAREFMTEIVSKKFTTLEEVESAAEEILFRKFRRSLKHGNRPTVMLRPIAQKSKHAIDFLDQVLDFTLSVNTDDEFDKAVSAIEGVLATEFKQSDDKTIIAFKAVSERVGKRYTIAAKKRKTKISKLEQELGVK